MTNAGAGASAFFVFGLRGVCLVADGVGGGAEGFDARVEFGGGLGVGSDGEGEVHLGGDEGVGESGGGAGEAHGCVSDSCGDAAFGDGSSW